MNIDKEQIIELQNMQEDIAGYFCDDYKISGETYWTCLETLAIAKLAELRGEIIFNDE